MGSLTDARIACWQEKSGIKPATGNRAELLRRISNAAFDAIKVIELELSGIRDGDGYWHGSDVILYTIDGLAGLCGDLRNALDDEQQPEHVPSRGWAALRSGADPNCPACKGNGYEDINKTGPHGLPDRCSCHIYVAAGIVTKPDPFIDDNQNHLPF